MRYSTCVVGLLLLTVCQAIGKADFVLSAGGPQAGGPTQTDGGGVRSIYLGRFFVGGPGSPDPFSTVSAGVSIANAPGSAGAPHVNLWAGISAAGQTGDFSAATQRVDTGVGFFNNTGGVSASANFGHAVSPAVGTALQTIHGGGAGVDFWLVANAAGSNFDAPAGVAGGGSNQFFVQMTAVPEPASLILMAVAVTFGAGFFRVRRSVSAPVGQLH